MTVEMFPQLKSNWPEWFTPGKTTPATHIKNVRAGRHPFGLPLLSPNDGERCGNCKHHGRSLQRSGKVYHKCALNKNTCGPGTDLRLKWAACETWEAE